MVRSNVRNDSGGSTAGDGGNRRARKSVTVRYARRAFVAIALAIALHAIVATLIPRFGTSLRGGPEVTTHATLARIDRRHSRPLVHPHPRRHADRVAAVAAAATVVPVAAAPQQRSAAHRSGAARTHAVRASSVPVWDAVAAQGAGTSNGAETGPGSGAGNGAGTGGGNQPCGIVTFSDPHGSRYDPNTRGFYVDIRMSVSFPDGHAESTILDYPFYYPNEAANPWSRANLSDPAALPRLQPPPAALAGSEPPLVQYVVAHSTADGLTLLQDCPSPLPASAKSS